ncbi:putative glycerophosphodiester phosphodiesterase [Helianthus annuus]|nr:putative glycerophosphodiester phosphodiesterase [Helianthus annuus]
MSNVRKGLPKFTVVDHWGHEINILQSMDWRMKTFKENSILSFNIAANHLIIFLISLNSMYNKASNHPPEMKSSSEKMTANFPSEQSTRYIQSQCNGTSLFFILLNLLLMALTNFPLIGTPTISDHLSFVEDNNGVWGWGM